jgi:hypothetical protein
MAALSLSLSLFLALSGSGDELVENRTATRTHTPWHRVVALEPTTLLADDLQDVHLETAHTKNHPPTWH